MKTNPFFAFSSSVFCLVLTLSTASFAESLPAGCGNDRGASPATMGDDVVITDSTVLAPLTQTLFPVVKMSAETLQKDVNKGIAKYYLKPEEREPRRFVIINGKTYSSDGRELISTHNKNKDTMNYVMDAAGNMYLFDEFTCKQIRHGNILAGGPVAGAGNISIKDGEIVSIDSDSGHYGSTRVFNNVLKRLELSGSKPQHP